MLSELTYGSLCIYHPRSNSPVAKASREVCYDAKGDRKDMVRRMLTYFTAKHAAGRSVLEQVIPTGSVLVPVPRSAPLPPSAKKDTHWPARRICEVLLELGWGADMLPLLSRGHALPASHRSEQGERPDLKAHIDSLKVELELLPTRAVTLVDDVVTKGTTLFAAASKLAEAYPDAELRALALVRTTGLVDDIGNYVEPTVGTVTLDRADRVAREP